MISTAPPRVASRSTPLERMRLQRGWTRKDLSARSGVCTRTISRIERAGVRPHRATLRVLAEAFGVEIADLFPVNDEARIPLPGPRTRLLAPAVSQGTPASGDRSGAVARRGVVQLRVGRSYRGAVVVAGGWVHLFDGQRRVVGDERVTYRPAGERSWPRRVVLEVRWRDERARQGVEA